MAAYEPYCDGVFECWTTKQLEQFVNVVAGAPVVHRARARGRLARSSNQGGSRVSGLR